MILILKKNKIPWCRDNDHDQIIVTIRVPSSELGRTHFVQEKTESTIIKYLVSKVKDFGRKLYLKTFNLHTIDSKSKR